MTVSIAFNGSGVNSADSTTGWGVVKITAGGGTPSVAVADGQIEGNGAVTTTVSGKRIILYVDVGAGNELNFPATVFSNKQLIYIWGNFLAPTLLNSAANGGFGVFMDSNAPSSNQYHLWYVYGNDNYAGGWRRFALDPREPHSVQAGTAINYSAIRYIGLFAETTSTARFDNLIVDAIDVGYGLRVTGSTTNSLMSELLAWEQTNRKGVFTALNDDLTAQELKGRIDIGSTTEAVNVLDNGGKVFLSNPFYYDSTGTKTPSCPQNSFGFQFAGTTGTQIANFGTKVGTSGGRDGTTFVGNGDYNLDIVANQATYEQVNFYGCQFELFAGGVNLQSASHEVMGCNFTQCGLITLSANATVTESLFVETNRVTLNGATMSDCRFINSTSSSALLVGSSVSTISDLIFTSSGTGHAIEITGGTTHTLNNITFNGYAASNGSTGNEAVYVNIPSGSVTINSDSALSYRTAGATVTVVAGQKTLTISNVVAGSDVVILSAGTTTVLSDNDGATNPVTSFDYSYTYSAGTFVDIAVYLAGYVPYIVRNYLLPSTGGTVQAAQVVDRNYTP